MHEIALTLQNLFNGILQDLFLKSIPSLAIGIFGILFGFENINILQALIILVVFDFITGIFSAYKAGEHIRSKVAVRSAYKLAVYGLLVSAGHITEQVTPFATFIEEAVTTFLALTEMISIIENAGKMGFAVPQKLLSKLHKLRDK